MTDMTPETAAGEAHTYRHLKTTQLCVSLMKFSQNETHFKNLNSKLWEAKAAAQNQTKDPTKNILSIPLSFVKDHTFSCLRNPP